MTAILFAALALASPSAPEASRDDLAQCLAHLSNAPEFSALASDSLGKDENFLDAAIGSYCASESSPFWKVAHQRARAELGLPEKGLPGDGQQVIAEREMRSIVGETWLLARTHRAHPRPLSEQKMADMALAWMLDEKNLDVDRVVRAPIACLATGARDGKGAIGPQGVTPSKALARSCGYTDAVEQLAGLLRTRFPEASPGFAARMAEDLLRNAAFWGALGP